MDLEKVFSFEETEESMIILYEQMRTNEISEGQGENIFPCFKPKMPNIKMNEVIN